MQRELELEKNDLDSERICRSLGPSILVIPLIISSSLLRGRDLKQTHDIWAKQSASSIRIVKKTKRMARQLDADSMHSAHVFSHGKSEEVMLFEAVAGRPGSRRNTLPFYKFLAFQNIFHFFLPPRISFGNCMTKTAELFQSL